MIASRLPQRRHDRFSRPAGRFGFQRISPEPKTGEASAKNCSEHDYFFPAGAARFVAVFAGGVVGRTAELVVGAGAG